MSAYEVDAHGQDEVAWDRYREQMQALAEQELEDDAYEADDPKSKGYHERASDLEDFPRS